MQVILRENIENLGRVGDVVKVKDGYARNYLLPRKLVIPADPNNLKALEHHKRSLEKKRKAQVASSEELAKRLEGHSCTLSRRVGENDKLFGSVTTSDIVEELAKAGFKIEKRKVHLKEQIKTLGVHPVTIRLEPEVEATLKVWVVKQEE